MRLQTNVECNYYLNVEVCAFHDTLKFSSYVYPEIPGSRPAIHLASSERGVTLQHITDRLNLICAQHNLGLPSKNVASLMSFAFEVRT